mgnify:CR=1 FL=1|jgi:hypothetical protein
MKLSLMVLGLLVCLATIVSAGVTNFSYNVPPGWNLIALPGIPLDPAVESVITTIPVDGYLFRWDPINQSNIVYDMFAPEVFGKLLLTDGYWLYNSTGTTKVISFSGLNDNNSMDIWVSIPKSGWVLIGNPFNGNFTWENAKVTDGNVTKTIRDASQYGSNWINSIIYGWNGVSQSLYDVGLPEDFPSSEQLSAWQGYWLKSNRDKIALILESGT